MFNYGAADSLVTMYGAWRVERTTFAFLLCDPVQRAQSFFYHFQHYDILNTSDSFKEWTHEQLLAPWDDDPSRWHEVWRGGLYADHLEAWLQVLVVSSSSFLVVSS